ncbi:MAG: hypothetical protein WCO99_08635, partial [Planctomycetota bacterium]
MARFTASAAALPGSDLELPYTCDYPDRRIRRSLDADGAVSSGRDRFSAPATCGRRCASATCPTALPARCRSTPP